MSGIFISCRRSDDPNATGRIYDRLVAEFGRAKVFKDIDSIPLGRDFRTHLNEVIGQCAVVLAIVGPRWLDARGEAGQRRLEDSEDFVRLELEAAMARDVPVVPVLVSHAPMPTTAQLPASLAPLAYRQSIEVRPDPDFHNDATRLLTALRRMLDPTAPEIDASADAIARAGSTAPSKPPSRRLAWTIAAIALVGMIAMLVPTLRHLRETPPPETRTEIVTPATDQSASFALSPDGRQIVFLGARDGASRLWLRSLATTTAQPLAGTEGARLPFWSPEGRSIGFFAAGALKRLDLGGGAPQILATGLNGRGGTWSADGVILFAPTGAGPLMRMAASGGAAVAVTTLGPQQVGHFFPQFLPDGRRFLFYVDSAVPETSGNLPRRTRRQRPDATDDRCRRRGVSVGLAAVGEGGHARGAAAGPREGHSHRRAGDAGRWRGDRPPHSERRVSLGNGAGGLPDRRGWLAATDLVRPLGHVAWHRRRPGWQYRQSPRVP